MNVPVFLIVGCLFFGVHGQHDHHHDHGHHRVNVTVYYESMCQDSIKFFTQQLYPSLQGNLSSYVNLKLLPYGKSKTTNELGQLEFTCHHGPAECRGNRIHACALRIIDNGTNSEGLGFNRVTTGFINCLMDKLKPEGENTIFPTQECATINKVQNYVNLENCANHVEGSGYLNDIGKETAKLNPPLKSVPTIVFDNNYKPEDSELATTNFVKALCQYIDGDKPAECTRNSAFSDRLSGTLLLSAAVAAVLFNYY